MVDALAKNYKIWPNKRHIKKNKCDILSEEEGMSQLKQDAVIHGVHVLMLLVSFLKTVSVIHPFSQYYF